ncbi:MAG TPA: hypothetical protein PKC93_11060 [Candidatus Obscuribacter sp.]|nr:hypothetical protein [Candidatus Obscuribacter sp.]
MKNTTVALPVNAVDGNWNTLTNWGLTQVGEPNSLTVMTELPAGWKLSERNSVEAQSAPTGQQLQYDLLDQYARKRADVVIITAPREKAFISLCRRYVIAPTPESDTTNVGFRVLDGGSEVFRTAQVACSTTENDKRNQTRAVASQWLSEHYPDYHNTAAYWD